MKMNLNLDVLKSIVNVNFEVVDEKDGMDYGFVNIRFERNLKKKEVVELSSEWLKGVKVWDDEGNEKEFVCCWGGGNVLCDNEIGLNLKEDEESCLDFDIDGEEGLYGMYESFEEYWNDVKGRIVGLDRYECDIEIY